MRRTTRKAAPFIGTDKVKDHAQVIDLTTTYGDGVGDFGVTFGLRSSKLMEAPTVERAFAEDYPHGAPSKDDGRLLRDVDGRPLSPEAVIVGRRVSQGSSETPSLPELYAVAKALTGSDPALVGAADLPSNAIGSFRAYRLNEGDPSIKILMDLTEDRRRRVLQHELGHAIDTYAGLIDQRGIGGADHLPLLYHELNDDTFRRFSKPRPGLRTSPESQGYPKAERNAELMAEAIRAYLQSPDYMKSRFPDVAARIRRDVNAHPIISKHIQFNSLGAAPFVVTSGGEEER